MLEVLCNLPQKKYWVRDVFYNMPHIDDIVLRAFQLSVWESSVYDRDCGKVFLLFLLTIPGFNADDRKAVRLKVGKGAAYPTSNFKDTAMAFEGG